MSKLTPLTRDKLLVVLNLEDVVTQLNLAMKARKAAIGIDFTGPQAKVIIKMPGTPKHVWFVADPRTKRTVGYHPADPSLRALTDDITYRLRKFDARLGMGITQLRDKRKVCKLMVFFEDSDRIVISLMHTIKNHTAFHDSFQVPKALQ